MKRYLVACGLALALLAMADQKASAWTKTQFSIGLHYSREASENKTLWGLFYNGPHPAVTSDHGNGYGYGGQAAPYYYQAPANGGSLPTLPAPASSAPAAVNQSSARAQQIGYYNYNYQTYPTTGYYTVPSYWYGN
jgi:hypothetical protein